MKAAFKKLFIDRQIRNICMSDPTKNAGIIKEITDDLFSRYNRDGIRMPFSIDVINDSTIRIKYGCQIKGSAFSDEMMPEDYAWLYSGEWSDWQPKCPTLGGPSFGGRFHYDIPKKDFYETVKKNNKHYGGNRIRAIDAGEDSEGFFVEITFG